MGTIIGILNREAVAVAADSAATFGKSYKTNFTSNKIFRLSEAAPVGVSIYGEDSFCGIIPWETVISEFRRTLGNETFDFIDQYVDKFKVFLSSFLEKYFKGKDDYLLRVLQSDVQNYLNTRVLGNLGNSEAAINHEDCVRINATLVEVREKCRNKEKIESLADYKVKQFSSDIKSVIDNVLIRVSNPSDKDKLSKSLVSSLYSIYTREQLQHKLHTGIAIFGFGESEIFPMLEKIFVMSSINNKLILGPTNYIRVENSGPEIRMMEEYDVASTFLNQISPQLQNQLREVVRRNTRGKLKNGFHASQISASCIEALKDKIHTTNGDPQEKSDLKSIISMMNKEDLASLAENLVFITSQYRKIQQGAESTGGPIDVAVVSKSDGFKWVKHKTYYDEALNRPGMF